MDEREEERRRETVDLGLHGGPPDGNRDGVERSGDRGAEAWALINLSAQDMEFGDYDLAFARLEAGLAAARVVAETEAASLALHDLGCLAWMRGEFHTAQQRAEEGLALARAEGWDWVVPSILVNYGLATADLGDLDQARVLLHEGLALGHARGLLDRCIAHARSRTRFGQPIGTFQAVQLQLANMATEIFAGERMALHVAEQVDAGTDIRTGAAMTKLYCTEMVNRAAATAVQIHGALRGAAGVAREPGLGLPERATAGDLRTALAPPR